MKLVFFSKILFLVILNRGYIHAQECILINSFKNNGSISNYYLNSDSSLTIKINNNNGLLREIRHYSDLTKIYEHGIWTTYFSNSAIKSVYYFNFGLPVGVWCTYTKNGKTIDSIDYDFQISYFNRDSSLTQLSRSDTINDELKYINVDKIPTFEGKDINAFVSYVQNRIKFNYYMYEKYQKTGMHKIYVRFCINKDGNLVDLKINDQNEKCLEKEAARVIRQSPRWTSGYMKDKPVKVQISFPVIFIFPK